VTLYAGGVISRVTGVEFYTRRCLHRRHGLYTIFGGLRAVSHRVLQAIVLILAPYAHGDRAVTSRGSGGQSHCPGRILLDVKPSSHPTFPWTGMSSARPSRNLYWCTTAHRQRVLAARTSKSAHRNDLRRYLKILPSHFVLPASWPALSRNPQQPRSAYPAGDAVLPDGIKGLGVRDARGA